MYVQRIYLIGIEYSNPLSFTVCQQVRRCFDDIYGTYKIKLCFCVVLHIDTIYIYCIYLTRIVVKCT